ncbi:MAG TPA: D-alanyl-D-alanine carboxypeptidase, partial [Candidatus Eisenbacteria bacterium]|nr:D-alanyl-D-alanine carboxypeptidase [Candidatus Eisenbacteria bacterium]
RLIRGGSFVIRPAVSGGRSPSLARVRSVSRGAAALLLGILAIVIRSAPSDAKPRGALADTLQALAGGTLDQVTVGALAVSLDRGDTLFAWRERDRLVPGSNTKIFTTGAFLTRFGLDARWDTRLLARGSASVKDGGRRVRFKGDLVLQGSGVPDVTALLRPGSRGLVDSMAVRLRSEGLERFEGTLWVDGSIFVRDPYPEGWTHDDMVYSYSAPVNGILANGNAISLIATEREGRVTLTLDPPESPLTVRGAISLADAGSAPRLAVRRDLGSTVLEVSGSVPPGGVARQQVAVTDPDSTAGLLLLGAMKRAGIETKAVVRVLPERAEDAGKKRKDVEPFLAAASPGTPAAGQPWSAVRGDRAAAVLTHASPTAAEIVSMVNTYSLNTEAEALLRMLDPAPKGKRTQRGLAELYRILSESGINGADVLLTDGSGLSRMNLATARALVAWLTVLDRALGPRFREGLSTPGGNGTLANRLQDLEPGVTLRGKTGTLSNVGSLSGYVTSKDGERLVFALIGNGTRGSVAPLRSVQDHLVRLLGGTRRAVATPVRPWGIPR